MKAWTKADIVELKVKSTMSDKQSLGYDGTFDGIDGCGTVSANASGNVGHGILYTDQPTITGEGNVEE